MDRIHANVIGMYRIGLHGLVSANATRATTFGGELTLNGPGLLVTGPQGFGAVTPSAYASIDNTRAVRAGAGIEGSMLLAPVPALFNVGVSLGSNNGTFVVRPSVGVEFPLHLFSHQNTVGGLSLGLSYSPEIPTTGGAVDHNLSLGVRLTGIPLP